MVVPTAEQEVIRSAAARRSGESLLINAYAGVGKTTTLALLAPGIRVPALALAFNKSIKETLSGRLPGNFKVMSLNGLGYGALSRAMPGRQWKIDDRKIGRIVSEVAKQRKMELGDDWGIVRELVRRAQLSGIVPGKQGGEGDWEELASELWVPEEQLAELCELAEEALARSNEEVARDGVISFDDQVYYSVCVAGRFAQWPVVMIDEAQDLSGLMREMLRRSVAPAGRLIAVGDSRQAIYHFRGADSDSMRKIRSLRDEWIELPLATTFRCPKVVVERQKEHAPGFRAAPEAPEGAFVRVGTERGWSWGDVVAAAPQARDFAVLCRNNAPLLKLAFQLIRARIPAKMAGRDIGEGLAGLAKRLFKELSGKENLLAAVADWEQTERSKAELMGREEKIAGVADRAESLRVVIEQAESGDLEEVLRTIRFLFARDSGAITLSTIHRAKGLEWDCVVHLDPWRVSSKRSRERGGKELEQERNLLYVAETRTKSVLVNANAEEWRE